jgi:hypothetical protein
MLKIKAKKARITRAVTGASILALSLNSDSNLFPLIHHVAIMVNHG